METLMDSFMNSCGDSFIQYFEKHRFKNLVNREDYKSLHSKMQLIFDESQEDGNNEIWIDVYNIIEFLWISKSKNFYRR